MRYAVARWNREQRDTVYRIFVTDALRIISKGTGCCMKYMENNRYVDLAYPAPADNRSPDEVIADVLKEIGLEVTE